MDTYHRDHKHPVSVGDHVRVDGSHLETGWTARLLRFTEREGTCPLAVVTAPKNGAGVRHVAADRLTRKHT